MTQYILELAAVDGAGQNLPRLIGPFNSRDEASTFAGGIINTGSSQILKLVAPAVAKSFTVGAPPVIGQTLRARDLTVAHLGKRIEIATLDDGHLRGELLEFGVPFDHPSLLSSEVKSIELVFVAGRVTYSRTVDVDTAVTVTL
jgi:hypothetical protein